MIKRTVLESRGNEADLLVSDGDHTFMCYAHPYASLESIDLESTFFLLGCKNIVRDVGAEFVRSLKGYSHKIHGTVISSVDNTIQVGHFVFECDSPLPGDVRAGEIVSLDCERISL